jgi:hypothetical protein
LHFTLILILLNLSFIDSPSFQGLFPTNCSSFFLILPLLYSGSIYLDEDHNVVHRETITRDEEILKIPISLSKGKPEKRLKIYATYTRVPIAGEPASGPSRPGNREDELRGPYDAFSRTFNNTGSENTRSNLPSTRGKELLRSLSLCFHCVFTIFYTLASFPLFHLLFGSFPSFFFQNLLLSSSVFKCNAKCTHTRIHRLPHCQYCNS